MTFAWIASIECRIPQEKSQLSGILEGLKVLVLEDEFLIAMDVEQLCLDHGASEVTVARKLSEVPGEDEFHAAVVDVLLDGVSTLDFADGLREAGKPFIFASGYTDSVEVATRFPGVSLVGKPYSGSDLIQAVATACGRVLTSDSA
jgi:CheY-like chemotaxis protein